MNEIKAAREAAGLSRAMVVEKIGVPYRTLEDYETDRRSPPEWVKRLLIKEIENFGKDNT